MDEQRLLELASSISDGEPVDWDKIGSEAENEEDRKLVRALKALAEVADAHRSWNGASTGELASSRPAPQRWGHLEILEQVGTGSFGDVYRARDTQLDRIVALKLLRRRGAIAPDEDSAIVEEGRLLARLRHPSVATVYGADQREERIGLWMEFIQGHTLSELVREHGPFGAREATLIGLDLCSALAAVHAQGIVHRDLKAQNVMREEGGRIVLTDFGIGRDLRKQAEAESSLSGTPLYLAPEIFAGGEASARSDIYSLGVLLYYLVTSTFPVRGKSMSDLRCAHEQGEVHLLRDVRPDLPEAFVRVVERALLADPAHRFASAGAMEQALAAVLKGTEGTERPVYHALRSPLLHWGLAAALLMIIGLLLPIELRERDGPTAGTQEGVLVAEFDNRTSVDLFDHTVRHLMSLALDQSSRLKVLSQERIVAALRRMERPGHARLDAETAREICLRENLGTLVTGEIVEEGDGYLVLVSASDVQTGNVRVMRRVQFSRQDDLIPQIDQLGIELRKELGEPRSLIEQNRRPLAQATTASLEALERFTRALELHARGEIEQAIESLRMAVEHDPRFATAYSHLALYLGGTGHTEEALAAAEQAYRLRERVPERERYQISATYHLERLQYEEALGEFKRAVVLDPQDASSWRQIALLHANLGDAEAGLDPARKARDADPGSVINQGVLVVLLAAANHPEEALQEVARARARLGDENYFYWGEGLAWLVQGDVQRARSALRKLLRGETTYASWGRLLDAQSLVYQGRLREAAGELESDLGRDDRKGYQRNRALRHYYLARIYALLGERQESLRQLSEIERLKDLPINLKDLRNAAVTYAELGDLGGAVRLQRRLVRLRDLHPSGLSRSFAAQIQGEIERSSGRPEAARQHLEEARRLRSDPSTQQSLARFWAAQSKCDRAVPILMELLEAKGWVLRDFFAADWVLDHLDLASCQRQLGQDSEARESFGRFLALWGTSGADLDVVRQAQRFLIEVN